ncbi:T-complex protein 1 subunit alpha [Striga hermonthica]|uniref:T-complex protein 1 subunit alpha n=1 Tax=Striga hermonthica TaxID=68872 RepID=A0A9N7RRW0_STRHE|nr:T-complex protein 1 subunit alpha [Striga hermonthica]
MLVDDIGDVTITNDGATILKMLEVEHPATKVLIELAELQDREVGDGTTFVVIIAAELLKVEKLGKDSLVNSAKTSMSSKCIGGDSDFFANLGINILKAHGQSARDSYLLKGYALDTGRAAQGMPITRPRSGRWHDSVVIIAAELLKVEKLGKDSLVNSAKTSMSSKLIGGDSDFFANLVIVACLAVANIVKSSLGPVGLDKMLVDDIGDVTITNDGATILKILEVEHPAAKVLVELAELQDREVGDGTTSVVIISCRIAEEQETVTFLQSHHIMSIRYSRNKQMKVDVKTVGTTILATSDSISTSSCAHSIIHSE